MPDIMGIGKTGEDIAYKDLINRGYVILDRNYKSKLGEIDIIARDGRFIVFVEVKTRLGIQYGYPREAVGVFKQTKIKNIASLYLTKKRLWDNQIRFDVVEIIMENAEKSKSLVVIKNAFE
jgi:putative endonuclease